MASTRIDGVRVAGIATAVPDRIRTAADDAVRFGAEEIQRVVKNTGVTRRTVAYHLCTSDLCEAAVGRLLPELGWSRETIDVLVLVTQTPDYPSPATACLMQNRLGLSRHVAAFDVNLGCSGYTYGLWLVASMLKAGNLRRGLVLAGDTVSRAAAPSDRAVVPLFGDAGSATALELDDSAPTISTVSGTDGSGGIHLHTLAGAAKHPITSSDLQETRRHDGVVRSNQHTYMNGAEVLTFAIQNVPAMVREAHAVAGWSESDVDHYVFHQASRFMLKNVGRCSRIPPDKLVIGLEGYGNTSSASIPVAINDQLLALRERSLRVVLGGFGIGWSWCANALALGPLVMPDVVRVPDVERRGEFEDLEAHRVVHGVEPP